MTVTRDGLRGACVLVLEDDYLQASDLRVALEAAGARVLGPFGNADEAAAALAEVRPDCAVLDVNLGDGPSFAVPEALTQQAVPFAFLTGYDADTIPDRFADTPRFEKPVDAARVLAIAERLLRGT